MDNSQTKSILTVALMAAFADGLKDEREREAIRKLAEALGAEASIDLPAWYRDVLLSRPDLTEVVQPLDTQGLRQYAYEMAVGVVNADGSQNAAEAGFPGSNWPRRCSCRRRRRVCRATGERNGGCGRADRPRGSCRRGACCCRHLPWPAPSWARPTSAMPRWTRRS